jgi:general L-amino acid transport system permease protein
MSGRLGGAFRWTRANLFSGPASALVTLLTAFFLWRALPPLFDWAVRDAVWSASDPAVCREAGGACWALIGQKYRFVLFGLYPYREQWRPALAVAIFVAALVATAVPAWWGRWLLWLWAAVAATVATLLWGGILGLPYVDNTQWGGLPLTLVLAAVGSAAAFPLSILLALGRRSDLPLIRALCVGVIELVRGVPLISVLFMASVMFPLFLPEGVNLDKLLRALIGIAIFTAAYLAEALRGGLQAIPVGQYEAADALGLTYWQKARLVILPQAVKHALPALVGQIIGMFKDTSLVVIIGLFDLMATVQGALSDPPWRPYYVEGYLFAALLYWIFAFSMSRYSQYLERRLGRAQGAARG